MKIVVGGLTALGLAAVSAVAPAPRQQAPFRASTELILIDTHVVARDGTPLEGLTADQFEVFIDGKRRLIDSVEFVRALRSPEAVGAPPAPTAPGVPPGRDGRVIMLGIDQASFPPTAQASAREAATRVVDSVAPEDYLGIVAFPGTIEIAPTRDRNQVRSAIRRINGLRGDIGSPRFSLSASEASLLKSKDRVAAAEVTRRECARDKGNVMCPQEVMSEASRIADVLEYHALESITGIRALLGGMAALPGRKTLLMVSAGIPMSNRPGGRPNLGAETEEIGRRAAAANVSLYVLYMNIHFLRAFSAEQGKPNLAIFADIGLFGQGLEKFADTGGGTFFQVQVQADPFVSRALRETSAWYVLAVQATPEERDGKEHFIRVSVKRGGASIRYRRVVMIPRTARD